MKRLGVFAFGLVLATLFLVPPSPAVDKDTINTAIERGVRFLKSQQLNEGNWNHTYVGATALNALALLECGVPPDDPSIQRAAQRVREQMFSSSHVYSISLSILFLDRLGDVGDIPLIESLTIRLLEGQTLLGTWSYNTPPPDEGELRRLRAVAPAKREKKGEGRRELKDLPDEVQDRLRQINQRRALHNPMIGMGDNSNTQFAILALWVGRRHGLPVDRALKETDIYFRKTQSVRDGGWGYTATGMELGNFPGGGGLQANFGLGAAPPPMMREGQGLGRGGLPMMSMGVGSSAPMTCAGLLGLGLAYGVFNESALRTDPASPDRTKPGPAKGGEAPAQKDPGKDAAVQAALRAIGATVDHPVGDKAGARIPRIGNNQGLGKAYYFLWSLERVAVAFDLDTIGNKEWYHWGAEILLANQDLQGGWTNGEYTEGCCDTSFALLFLKRANLLSDLTRSLQGRIKDPAKVALKAGGVGGGAVKQMTLPRADDPAGRSGDATVGRTKPATPGTDPSTPAGKLAAQAVESKGAKQTEAIAKLREGKGAAYTDALAAAIGQLDGDARKKAREALADRLANLTAASLAGKLEDENLEVRRAAALACAMKEEKDNLEKIMDLLEDPEPPVARAAHAALKSLTGQDLGPTEDATRAEKTRAIAAWKAWWQKQKK